VGQELHDQVGSSLTLLKLATHKARQGRSEKIEESLAEIEKIVNEIYEEVRTLSHSLRPDMLNDLGLTDALDARFEEYTDQCGVKVHFKPRGLKKRLPSEVEITVFCIVQEALVNVARHAKASAMSIQMACESDRLRVQIRDNGCGVDPAETESLSSGISGMQGRAYLMGGTLTVDSSPGVGTCITCEIPVSTQGQK
jgi:signal transduction histidine kinase